MAEKQEKGLSVPVEFIGLPVGEKAPVVAVYATDAAGRATKRLGRIDGPTFEVPAEWVKLNLVALGPDRDDLDDVPRESLIAFRLDTIVPHWREHGLQLGPEIWGRFFFDWVCVSGVARKCRPWWWRRFEGIDLALPAVQFLARPEMQLHFPASCLPLCDGIVEVFERECCCHRLHLPDLLDRLRELLEVIPIPRPGPWPWPEPGPWPGPGPDPGPLSRPAAGAAFLPSSRKGLVTTSRAVARGRGDAVVHGDGPSERLFDDYEALVSLDRSAAEAYVLARPYLLGLICSCQTRKVGEVPLQPGGRISFCYRRPRRFHVYGTHCSVSHAFRIRQQIGGAWVTVYDGVAAHDWFAEGEEASVRTWNWQAQVCGSGPGDPPPGGPLPFVMLEHVTGASTHHFNFPAQDGVSHVAPLDPDDGLYTTGYAPDCPWGGSLGLRLWFSPELEGIAKYYRVSVLPVADNGTPSAAPVILDASVSWQRFEFVGGTWVSVPELLSANPADVGGQTGLVRIPYWSGGKHWLSGQYHQLWNTALANPGRYLLVVEVFDAAAARLKPNGATGAGTGAAFELRRWTDPNTTAPVAFADLAHVFWSDNTPVGGDIVDIRKDHVANDAECQFLSGPANTTVSLGMRAYHPRGVSDPANTFMKAYTLTWQRGLNGPSGVFESGTSDVGEPPAAAHESASLTLGFLLGPHPNPPQAPFPAQQKCTFAAQLHVEAKHWNGGGRIYGYDYHETASFALSLV